MLTTDEPQSRDPAVGWGIVGILSAILVAMTVTVLVRHGFNPAGMQALLRTTARTSFLLFLIVFVTSPLSATWPGSGTRWLFAHRRYLGVSFAVSHTIHFAGIAGLAIMGQAMSRTVLVIGGLGYAFIVAMAATSFDRSAAWLGRARWKRLHTTGLYYLWFVFVATFLGHVRHSLIAAVCAALLVAALGWRLAAPRPLSLG